MAWIMNKKTNTAVNLDYIVRMVASNDYEVIFKYGVNANDNEWIVYANTTNDDTVLLNSFDTQEEATEFIINLARWQETGVPPKNYEA